MKKNKLKKSIILPVMAAVVITGLGAGVLSYSQIASAATTTPPSTTTQGRHGFGKGSGVGGTVTAINGSSITLTGKNSTTYTVDATNAKITEFPQIAAGTTPTTRPVPVTIAITDIKIGDTIMARGTVSGTSVTATSIMDGKFMGNRGVGAMGKGRGVGGTVASISGNTITLTGKNSTTYTVDATNAKIMKLPAMSTTPTTGTPRPTPTTIAVSDIATGDTLMVQGAVNGTSVTATNIMDGKFMGRGPANHGTSTPHVGGTVTAVNGDSITVNDTHNKTGTPVVYTVDITNAKLAKWSSTKGTAPTTITASDIVVGDNVMVSGTINGTSVTATNVMTGIMMRGPRSATPATQ